MIAHVVINGNAHIIKAKIRDELREHGVGHITLEFEFEDEPCNEEHCHIDVVSSCGHHHHHH